MRSRRGGGHGGAACLDAEVDELDGAGGAARLGAIQEGPDRGLAAGGRDVHGDRHVRDEARCGEHLLGLGHRDVVVMGVEAALGETDDEGVAARRLAGYRGAFAGRGIELPPDRIIRPPATIEGGEAAFLRVWSRGDRPTAVLCMSDATATGVLAAARRLGVRVPEELSIVGFDDLPEAAYLDPPLTSVRQDFPELGRRTMALLERVLAGEEQPTVDLVPTSLVVRSSTAAPRTASR